MWKKLFQPRIWQRIYNERLGEPVIFNIASILVYIFGDFRRKIDYDLVPRQPYAFGLKTAFQEAKATQAAKILIVEFGVASGAGLFNLAKIAKKLSKIYNIDYHIIGFDAGTGLPEPLDYRDHPEKYLKGDFPGLGLEHARLPDKTTLAIGQVKETLEVYLRPLLNDAKVGFVSIDVDYYSSTKDCLRIFDIPQIALLPKVIVYFDDINNIDHNEYCGELLAIAEFNTSNKARKLCKMNQLRNWRIFKNAIWIDQMYFMHCLDSDLRMPINQILREPIIINNPYITKDKNM